VVSRHSHQLQTDLVWAAAHCPYAIISTHFRKLNAAGHVELIRGASGLTADAFTESNRFVSIGIV
jgi:hypothetical protein